MNFWFWNFDKAFYIFQDMLPYVFQTNSTSTTLLKGQLEMIETENCWKLKHYIFIISAPYWPEDADFRFQYSLSGHSMGIYNLQSDGTESNPAEWAAVGLDWDLTSPGA